jgi:hypothetical protein
MGLIRLRALCQRRISMGLFCCCEKRGRGVSSKVVSGEHSECRAVAEKRRDPE